MTPHSPHLGVLEGFYGRPWTPASRCLMMRWLPALGFDAYLYAPKADAYLRKAWRQSWPREERAHLQHVSQECMNTGLSFQLGLSPFDLYRDYNRPARAALKSKLQEIEDLGVSGLAILFDDMPGDVDSLAARQAEICNDIHHWFGCSEKALRVCPTYYSDDRVLDDLFGARPDTYLHDLSQELPSSYEVFWTGPEVCARAIASADLADISHSYHGRIALWDNYPVNDSRARSPHLYMQAIEGRSPDIGALIASHWCNAMNQPALSLAALASLPGLYGRVADTVPDVFREAGLSAQLIDACEPLAHRTRSDLGPSEIQRLDQAAAIDSVAGLELRDWLAGGYEFDPACLTG